MILLDTHIWVWWVHRDERLPARLPAYLKRHERATLGGSAISCLKVANQVERGRPTRISWREGQRPSSYLEQDPKRVMVTKSANHKPTD